MWSRSSKVRSSSIRPMTLRSVVCASWVMATMKLLDPYEASFGSVTWKYRMPST